jgi:hypothetical protein
MTAKDSGINGLISEWIGFFKTLITEHWFTILIIIAVISAVLVAKQVFFTPCEGCVNGGHGIPIPTKEGYQDLNLEAVGSKLPAEAQGLAMDGTPELDSQVTGLPLANQQPLNTIPAEPVTTTTTIQETTTTTTEPETTTTTIPETTTTIPETTTTTTEPETTTTTTTIPAVTIRYVNLADLENKKESQSAAMYLSA